ncbi:MAG: ferritin [Deltaproteobacteria bacterium]|nr:ferritin [Deltaproteobacteria bacterium]
MISKKMTEDLNKHLNAELYSAYLYWSMSAYASHKGLKGAASWLYLQAQEEVIHVQKFYAYLDSQGARVIMEAVGKPPSEFGSFLELFEGVLAHEQEVTGLVNTLMSKATGEGDHATQTFLQWFVTEQVEEEQNAKDIIDRLKLAGDTGPAIFMIDNELGARTLATTPA